MTLPKSGQPRSTPGLEWLERNIRVWAEWTPILLTVDRSYVLSEDYITSLARHLLGNWLQVEDAQVRELVEAAREAWYFLPEHYTTAFADRLGDALAPFEMEKKS